MHLLTPMLVSGALLLRGVLGETDFSQPPGAGPANNFQDNPQYKDGEKIDVQWSSNLTSMDLVIWQQYPMATATDFYYNYLLQNTRSTSLIYTITLDGFATNVSKGEDAIFYFAVYSTGQTVIDGSSHYFNVTMPTTTTTSATATATKHKGKATTSAAAAETTTAGSDSDDSDNSMSTGAVAGIAVGSTVGGLALLGALGFFLWRHLRKAPGDSSGQYTPGQQYPPTGENKPPMVGSPGWVPPPYGQTDPSQAYGQTPVQHYGQPGMQQAYVQGPPQEMGPPEVHEAPADQPKNTPIYEAP